MADLPVEFLALTARLGADPLQVQGPGGNTSYKEGDRMWVKASGTLLADAGKRDIFAEVPVAAVVAALDGPAAGDFAGLVQDSSGLRPSIETAFHALLPHKVVLHTHSVASIAHGITAAGRATLEEKLMGLEWVMVPYAKPGLPVARAMRDRMQDSVPQVFILANHGLVVGAATPAMADELIREVERRLWLSPRQVAALDPASVPAGWHWVAGAAALAIDQRLLDLASGGSYYPDHVVFLGPSLPVVADVAMLAELEVAVRQPAVLVRGMGVALADCASPAAALMLQCLHDVLVRLASAWQPTALLPGQEDELLDWDAEKYRQQLVRGRAAL